MLTSQPWLLILSAMFCWTKRECYFSVSSCMTVLIWVNLLTVPAAEGILGFFLFFFYCLHLSFPLPIFPSPTFSFPLYFCGSPYFAITAASSVKVRLSLSTWDKSKIRGKLVIGPWSGSKKGAWRAEVCSLCSYLTAFTLRFISVMSLGIFGVNAFN